MATYFLDLDGTIFKWGTNDLLPGARELLDALVAAGHYIVFTTRRGNREFDGHKIFSKENTLTALYSLAIAFQVVFDSTSPRIVVNDEPCDALSHRKDGSWEQGDIDWAMYCGRRLQVTPQATD